MRGRVASLLEIGTGFHPELTGRENIFLNGAILGMSKAEIKKKFDEIVNFAEVEKFLDTPVKRYSSGMYVRLAFAVAAHLEPEFLIVDEVLAVWEMHSFISFNVVEVLQSTVIRAMDISIRNGYSYWDSLILAVALENNCSILYTEDMQDGQMIDDKLRIMNPFAAKK